MVAASITAVVAIINSCIKSYNNSANAAKVATEQTVKLAAAYKECATTANELKDAISNYDAGLNALRKLEKGTDEYKTALEEANKQAKELIEKYQLIAGQDYTIGADGLIKLKTGENSSLYNKQQVLETKAINLQNQMNAARYKSGRYNIDSAQLEFQRKTGIDNSSDIEKRYNAIIGGMSLIPGIGPLMAIGGQIGKASSEVRGYNLDKKEVSELIKALQNSQEGYDTILAKNDEAFKE